MIKNYYTILDISRDSSSKDIKKAYRKLALKYHPDVNKMEGAKESFIRVTEAYEILDDEDKRREYDLLFKSEVNSLSNEDFFNYKSWVHQAETKAETHSNMPYDKFESTLDKVLDLAGYGCGMSMVYITIGLFLLMIIYIFIGSWAKSPLLGIFATIWIWVLYKQGIFK